MGWFGFGGSESSSSSSSSSSSPLHEDLTSDPSAFSSSFDTSLGSGLDSSSDFGSSSSSSGGLGKDAELQSFLMMEQQKAQMQAMIHKMNETCWEVCVGTPGSRLDARTETCISNCVDRFIDSSLFITNRFAQLLAKSGGAM